MPQHVRGMGNQTLYNGDIAMDLGEDFVQSLIDTTSSTGNFQLKAAVGAGRRLYANRLWVKASTHASGLVQLQSATTSSTTITDLTAKIPISATNPIDWAFDARKEAVLGSTAGGQLILSSTTTTLRLKGWAITSNDPGA